MGEKATGIIPAGRYFILSLDCEGFPTSCGIAMQDLDVNALFIEYREYVRQSGLPRKSWNACKKHYEWEGCIGFDMWLFAIKNDLVHLCPLIQIFVDRSVTNSAVDELIELRVDGPEGFMCA